MRGESDHRPSVVLKSWQLSMLMTSCSISDIHCAYDDREDVVKMYRRVGINAEVVKIHDSDAYNKSPVLTKPISFTAGELDSPKKRMPWTKGQTDTLVELFEAGADTKEMAEKTGHCAGAIYSKLNNLGLKLDKPEERISQKPGVTIHRLL
jgi:hypothetical protein